VVYVDDKNLIADYRYTVKKNTETVIDVFTEVGLDINIEKSKYILLGW
jgi:hypothetical protein